MAGQLFVFAFEEEHGVERQPEIKTDDEQNNAEVDELNPAQCPNGLLDDFRFIHGASELAASSDDDFNDDIDDEDDGDNGIHCRLHQDIVRIPFIAIGQVFLAFLDRKLEYRHFRVSLFLKQVFAKTVEFNFLVLFCFFSVIEVCGIRVDIHWAYQIGDQSFYILLFNFKPRDHEKKDHEGQEDEDHIKYHPHEPREVRHTKIFPNQQLWLDWYIDFQPLAAKQSSLSVL